MATEVLHTMDAVCVGKVNQEMCRSFTILFEKVNRGQRSRGFGTFSGKYATLAKISLSHVAANTPPPLWIGLNGHLG